jgi:hypothetical protein
VEPDGPAGGVAVGEPDAEAERVCGGEPAAVGVTGIEGVETDTASDERAIALVATLGELDGVGIAVGV